jgi:uncharacterized protein (TIGR02246 family)
MRKTVILLALLAVSLLGISGRSGEKPAPATNDAQAIRQAVAAFADAFNKGDAAGLAAIWDANAEYIDEAGKMTRGREAIANLFKGYLTAHKGSKMVLKTTSIRPVNGDVALQDGTSVITGPDGAVDEGRFTAVWVKNGGRWQLRSARDLPSEEGESAGPGGALKELRWLVGDWEAGKGAVNVSVRWALNRAYLKVDYQIKGGDSEMSVMQLIGFDPLNGQIKSWTFDSVGGYGEGLWKREGNTWMSDTAGVLPTGQTGTALNVVRYVDDNTFVFQARDRDVSGQPLPDSEVKLTRKPAAK